MAIEIIHLTHTYMPGSPFQSTAIHDVSLTINDGEFVGIIGHTGSGKSTLIQHFNALLTPTSGKILVNGVNLHDPSTNKKTIRQKIGLVFQYPEHQLFEETLEKDVAFGPKNLGLSQDEIDARVQKAFAQVGLDFDLYRHRSPFELSGGQMRRAAIAGVLAMEPEMLVLDEPTAGLDPAGRDEILSMIQALHQAGGLTVVMVTHSMDDIAQLASRILVMSKGALVADGPPGEIFSKVQFMESIGLGVPQATQLLHALAYAGWNIPVSGYTVAAAADVIEQYLLAHKGDAYV
ncbi:MAG: energy-coupling factor transporter ATPase [Clostridiales bacterium]|nr:energy-coupling factor transporter ATPase [Clostridiales bacterium]